jgi:hypothetical protein
MVIAIIFDVESACAAGTVNWQLVKSGKVLLHISNPLQYVGIATSILERVLLREWTGE